MTRQSSPRQRSLVDTAVVDVGGSGDVSQMEHGSLAPRVLVAKATGADSLDAPTITTTKTAFATTATIPANALLTGRLLRVTAVFDEVTSSTPATQLFTLQAEKTGPTDVDLWASAAITPTASCSHRGASLGWLLQVTSPPGAAATVEAGCVGGVIPGAAQVALSNTVAQPASVDSTAALTLGVTLTFGASTTGNIVSLRQLVVEEIAAGSP